MSESFSRGGPFYAGNGWGGSHKPPPPPPPLPPALEKFFDLPFTPDLSPQVLAQAAGALLDTLPRETTNAARDAVVGAINRMFTRYDNLQKDLLNVLREQARAEVVREMKGTADATLWVEPASFDKSTYVLDEKVGVQLARLAKQLGRRDVYVERGIRAPTRLLFGGLPGTGKTMGAQWLAAMLDKPIGIVRADELSSHFIAMTAKNIAAVVKEAEERGGILFLDEVDGLFMRRDSVGTGGSSEEFRRITTAFLQILNNQPREQIIICATNLIDRLDPALLRRFPTRVTFNTPDAAARKKIAGNVLVKMDVSDEAMARLVERTEGASGDHVTNVAHTAASYAIDANTSMEVGHVHQALLEVPQPPNFFEERSSILG